MATEKPVVDGGVLKDGEVMPGTGSDKPVVKKNDDNTAKVKMVEVDIGGVKASVPEIFVNEFKAIQQGYTSLKFEVEELKKPKHTPVENSDDPLANIDTELFQDPKAAVAKIIKAAQAGAVSQVSGEQAINTARTEFWNEFYKTHTDLDRDVDGDVVQAVMGREFQSLASLKVPEAIKALGEKSKEALLKIATKRGAKPGAGGKPLTEGGNEPAKKGSKPIDDGVSPHSGGLSAVIRERRAARAKASKS